jgi:hypothetical protein
MRPARLCVIGCELRRHSHPALGADQLRVKVTQPLPCAALPAWPSCALCGASQRRTPTMTNKLLLALALTILALTIAAVILYVAGVVPIHNK